MSNTVLCVDPSHNATIGLSIDGEVKCLLSEERICRIKNAWCWPKNALKYAVDTYLDGDVSKIDKVVFPSEDLFFVEFLNAHNGWEKPKSSGYYWHEYQKKFDIALLRSKLNYAAAIFGVVFSGDSRFKSLLTPEYIAYNIAQFIFPPFGKFLNKIRRNEYIKN
jgi:predicted NodU family carbamoyl transferase